MCKRSLGKCIKQSRWVHQVMVLMMGLFGLQAVDANDLAGFDKTPEKGWYFYQAQPAMRWILPHAGKQLKRAKSVHAQKKNGCGNALTWSAKCGFINPATKGLTQKSAFHFEQTEYHQLMHNYALYPNNLTAVYQFQRFNMWVLNQAMTASYTWQYNLSAHPDVDANVQVPVSQFGIALIKNIQTASEASFWANLSKHGFFVLITRTHNRYCQAQGTLMKMLEHQTGVTVWNFSVDKSHLPEFKHYMNYPRLSAREQKAVGTHLKLSWLPAVYLYLKPASSHQVGRWIKITSGITPLNQIMGRTINFVEAYRHAIIEGAGKQKHIVPNFSVNHLYELADNSLGLDKSGRLSQTKPTKPSTPTALEAP